jgi:hypothetical protein
MKGSGYGLVGDIVVGILGGVARVLTRRMVRA